MRSKLQYFDYLYNWCQPLPFSFFCEVIMVLLLFKISKLKVLLHYLRSYLNLHFHLWLIRSNVDWFCFCFCFLFVLIHRTRQFKLFRLLAITLMIVILEFVFIFTFEFHNQHNDVSMCLYVSIVRTCLIDS